VRFKQVGALSYHISRRLVQALFLPFIRIRVVGAEKGKVPGPCLLAANHLSHFDPPFFTATCPRAIDWIAMTELFENPWLARYFRGVDCIEVDRFGTDTHAIREAVKRLKAGRVVGVFPEGGIRAGAGSVLEGASFKGGIGLLAQLTGAPVWPAVILGSDRAYAPRTWRRFRATTVWLLYGDPIEVDRSLPKKAQRESVDQALAESFTKLYADAQARFQLQTDDLPKTPQARKGQEP